MVRASLAMCAAPSSAKRPDLRVRLLSLRRVGPYLAVFIACFWLNQSYGLITWQKVRYGVFTDPGAHVFEAVRYPFIFLYRRSADEAMYYGVAAQILGQPYDNEVFELHTRGHLRGLPGFESPPPPSDGHWHMPWREVELEYPPLVVPFMVAPKLVTTEFESYARLFGFIMGLCMIASIALAIDTLKRAGASRDDVHDRWWLASGLLLAEGALTIQRLDPIVALLMAAMVHGAVRRSVRQLGAFAGLAGACKVLPLLLLPVMLLADWATWRRHLVSLSGWVALGLVVGFAPMLVASPGAVVDFFRYHGLRGLQVESTLGLFVGAYRWFAGTGHPTTVSFGSFNLDGAVPDLLARITVPLTLTGMAALAWREARGRGAPLNEANRVERIACAAVAGTVVLWIGGKVFSPQYLTWGIPLVLAIPGSRGTRAAWMAVIALTLTQVYYRGFYSSLIEQTIPGIATALVRQGVLVALLVFVRPRARGSHSLPLPA